MPEGLSAGRVYAELGATLNPEGFAAYDARLEQAKSLARTPVVAKLEAAANTGSVTGYTTKVKEAEAQTRQLGSTGAASTGRLSSGFAKAAASTIAFVGAYAGFHAVKQAVQTTEDFAHATERLHIVTGLSVTSASEWVGIAKVRGIEANALTRTFGTLEKQIAAAESGSKKSAKAFHELGISQAELKRGDISEIIGSIADKFQKMPDGIQKSALAQQLFGRTFSQILPLLNQGNKALQEQLATAAKYGVALNEKTIGPINKLIANQRTLKLEQLGLSVQFTGLVAPALLKVEAAAIKVGAIFAGPGSIQEKMKKAGEVAKPFSTAFQQGFVVEAPKLANFIVNNLVQPLATSLVTAAPRLVDSFIKAFSGSNIWGQLAVGGFILSRLGLLGPALAKLGASLGRIFGIGIGEKAAEEAAIRTEGGLAASSTAGRFTSVGRLLGSALAGGAAAYFAIDFGDKITAWFRGSFADLIKGPTDAKVAELQNKPLQALRKKAGETPSGEPTSPAVRRQEATSVQRQRQLDQTINQPTVVGDTATSRFSRAITSAGTSGDVAQLQKLAKAIPDALKLSGSLSKTEARNLENIIRDSIRRINANQPQIAKGFKKDLQQVQNDVRVGIIPPQDAFRRLTQNIDKTLATLPVSSLKYGKQSADAMIEQAKRQGTITSQQAASMHRHVAAEYAAMAGAAGTQSKRAADATIANFARAHNLSANQVRALKNSVGGDVKTLADVVSGDMSKMTEALNAQLVKLGVAAVHFTSGQFAGDPGHVRAGQATGGIVKAATGLVTIGREGEAGSDTVPINIMAGRGEKVAVFTRHQQAIMDRVLAYWGGLQGLFQKVRTPHYANMANGGIAAPTLGGPQGYLRNFGQTDMSRWATGMNAMLSYIKAHMPITFPLPQFGSEGRVDRGQDMEASVPNATTVAVGPGVVVGTGLGFPGMQVRMTGGPGAGHTAFYGHNKAIKASLGQHVSGGDPLGETGGEPFAGATHTEIGFDWNGGSGVSGSWSGPGSPGGKLMHRILHAAFPGKIGAREMMASGGFATPPGWGGGSISDGGNYYHGGLKKGTWVQGTASVFTGAPPGLSTPWGGAKGGYWLMHSPHGHWAVEKQTDVGPNLSLKRMFDLIPGSSVGDLGMSGGLEGGYQGMFLGYSLPSGVHTGRISSSQATAIRAGSGGLVRKYDDRTLKAQSSSQAYWDNMRKRNPRAFAHWHSTAGQARAARKGNQAAAPAAAAQPSTDYVTQQGFTTDDPGFTYGQAKADATGDTAASIAALKAHIGKDQKSIGEAESLLKLYTYIRAHGYKTAGGQKQDKGFIDGAITSLQASLAGFYGDVKSSQDQLTGLTPQPGVYDEVDYQLAKATSTSDIPGQQSALQRRLGIDLTGIALGEGALKTATDPGFRSALQTQLTGLYGDLTSTKSSYDQISPQAQAQAGLDAFNTFTANRASLFTQFGRNFVPAGQNPFGDQTQQAAGARAYGAASGGPVFNTYFAAPPPEAHQWSEQMRFQAQTAFG